MSGSTTQDLSAVLPQGTRAGAFRPGLPAAAARWGFAAFLLVLLASPTVPIIYQAFIDRPLYQPGAEWTFGNFTRLLVADAFLRALCTTLWFVVNSPSLSQLIGLVCGLLLARVALPFRRLIRPGLSFPLFISHLLLALH